MKLCIPVQENNGLDSVPYGHFGSAPMFIIADTDTETMEVVDNGKSDDGHGMCDPLGAFGNIQVDAVLVGGIGARAIGKLNEVGIRVFRSNENTIRDNIKLARENALEEITPAGGCSHHHGGGCSH